MKDVNFFAKKGQGCPLFELIETPTGENGKLTNEALKHVVIQDPRSSDCKDPRVVEIKQEFSVAPKF